jgi:hydrogenase nickel incorporation protein HypA/HybF
MHEIGALHQAVKLVNKIAKENQVDKVKYITLEIGELTGFLPVFFEKYFPVVAEEFPLVKDAELRMIIVRGQAICTECETLYNVMRCEGACPQCKSREKKILGGTEFRVKDIGL